MRPTMKRLSVLCACTLLFACADVSVRSGTPAAAQHFGSADEAYLLGRSAHLRGRIDQALAAYHATLHADPGHVNARNGVATLHAEQGEFAKAIPLWQALTAAAPAGPQSAFLFSNLGYAQLLSGDAAAAVVTLEKACLLDPLNPRAWHHLGSALDKLGEQQRAQLMYKQASALEAHDFKADYALVQGGGVAAIDNAVAAARAPDGYIASALHENASGVFELRRSDFAPRAAGAAVSQPAARLDAAREPDAVPAAASATAAVVTSASAGAIDLAKLEIRNGNGVTGMARKLARSFTGKIGELSLRVVRLSNQKGYNVEQTRIEYQPGFRDAAMKLAERFDNVAVLEVDSVQFADVRLVIGRDLMRSKVEARRLIRQALARAATANRAQ